MFAVHPPSSKIGFRRSRCSPPSLARLNPPSRLRPGKHHNNKQQTPRCLACVTKARMQVVQLEDHRAYTQVARPRKNVRGPPNGSIYGLADICTSHLNTLTVLIPNPTARQQPKRHNPSRRERMFSSPGIHKSTQIQPPQIQHILPVPPNAPKTSPRRQHVSLCDQTPIFSERFTGICMYAITTIRAPRGAQTRRIAFARAHTVVPCTALSILHRPKMG
jgi:hypothetical protein